MIINRLILDKVACFEHADIRFQPGQDPKKADIHILVGPNGAGKTTVLMAMAQFFTLEPVGLQARLRSLESSVVMLQDDGSLAGIALNSKRSPLQRLVLDDAVIPLQQEAGELIYYHSGRPDLLTLRQIAGAYVPSSPQYKDVTFETAAFAYSGQRSVASYTLGAIQELKTPPLAGACNFSKSGDPAQLVQWIANSRAKEAFAIARGDQTKAGERREAITRIESIISEVIGSSFAFEMDDDPLNVTARVDGRQVELDVLPDGLKSIISWVADLLIRMDRIPWADDTPVLERPFFLFLDEIEVHLHPAWQRKVLPTVQTLFPNAQIFISTHSPFIIASADDAWIYPLHLDGRQGVVGAPLESKVGASYATVLRDVLGVESEFGPQVEEKLGEFYALRNDALRGDGDALIRLRGQLEELRSFGEEVLAIVYPELKQVERRLARKEAGGDS